MVHFPVRKLLNCQRVGLQFLSVEARYFLHMSAMGLEPWDHVKPFEAAKRLLVSFAGFFWFFKVPIGSMVLGYMLTFGVY